MRLVIQFYVTDGYTYGFDCVVPVVYESAEAFAVEFEVLCHKHHAQEETNDFEFAGQSWDADNHFGHWNEKTNSRPYEAPDIFTVDEWFAEVE